MPASPTSSFVHEQFNPADFAQVEPLYRALIDRPVAGRDDLARWLADFSALHSRVDEHGTRCYIDKSCRTDDPEAQRRYLHFIEEIEPRIKPLFFQLQRKFVQCPDTDRLDGERYGVLHRKWLADVEQFRDENVPLETQVARLVNDYDSLCAARTVTIDGVEYTLQQAARFLEEPDRARRQNAWELMAQRRLRDREPADAIFDQLLALRARIAANAGAADFRQYTWKSYKRFDYTPDDCMRFAEAIETHCVPLARQIDRQRRADLRLPALRPWDLSVDPLNRPPLRPFDPDRVEDLVRKTAAILERVSGDLAADFEILRARQTLDLASRKGKQPGGYQAQLEAAQLPFIFMNAAGRHDDVETFLHECGHAFHFLAASRHEPVMFTRSTGMEFAEVASMSMELFGGEYLEEFYSPADADRARRRALEGIVLFMPWMATIDQFQHWLYTRPAPSPAERAGHWTSLQRRFGRDVDWTGLEEIRAAGWQNQIHIFQVPFYYVEYGIAQLGALQLWLKAQSDPHGALARYRAALALGGSRPLPELFAAAGIEFDFSERTVRPLMAAVAEALQELPR